MKKTPFILSATLFISLALIATSGATLRGIHVKAKDRQGAVKEIQLYKGYYALVVGCGNYSDGWPKLPNPVKDAKEVSMILKEMGWTVDLLEDPDWDRLDRSLNELIVGPGKEKENGVLFWFSGHGHTLDEADGTKLGYIVPVDAPLPGKDEMGFMRRAIDMRQIETVAKRIRSKHVMMVFDSCFSGAIFSMVRAAPSQYIQEKVASPVREFITAGRENEQVPDRSVFKTCFIQGVRDGDADLNRDGYVTGEELGSYLQEKVVNYSRNAQHPQFGKINNPKLDKGDFVFVVEAPIAPVAAVVQNKVAAQATQPTAGPRIIGEKLLTGQIQVTSNVDGADFQLVGHGFKTKERSAITIGDVPVGEHEISASKDGYQAWQGKVRVEPEQTAKLSIQLAALPTPTTRAQKDKKSSMGEKRNVFATLKGWERAFNRLDIDHLMFFFTEDARITTNLKGKPTRVSKNRYKKILKKRAPGWMKDGLQITLGKPKRLQVKGDKAVVIVETDLNIPGKRRHGTRLSRFKMEKHGTVWLISELGPAKK